MMFLLFLLALVRLELTDASVTSRRGQDREMLLAFVVNRHGERSPDADELSLAEDPERIKNITYIEGLEGLTNVGKRRAYQIGKFLRQRYGPSGWKLLSQIYFQDEIMLRSTDKERTKMTAMMAMSALYPPAPEQQWDEGLGKVWQPVPYTAIPLSEDYLRYYSNCQHFKQLMSDAKAQSLREEFANYTDLIAVIKANTGRDFTEDVTLFQVLFDLFRSEVAMGLEIPEWAKPLMPRLGEAAKLAYRLYFRTDEMKKIGGGVILNDFLEAASALAEGKTVKKRFRMFSSHDFNIGSLMEVSKVQQQEQSIPEYGSLFGLELYRSISSGELTVLPIYLPHAGESKVQQLHFASGDTSFDRFRESTLEYALPEHDYYKICNIKTEL
ncbi:venom acid phosphatase Acph-1-like [Aricia agestis]|uniref:venom acid phosphatase Acph-1-like n=1 Tax=Aricia agestis TaxID=91739 RepID=UPI001C205053|nr:venom acid phosphatase Acph-1-like [Aricia agestis]XP_041969772.1 venom acid phosphatase Acph-1-like [Aricia agestis]